VRKIGEEIEAEDEAEDEAEEIEAGSVRMRQSR